MKTIALKSKTGSIVPVVMVLGALFGIYYYRSRGGSVVELAKRLFGFLNEGPARPDNYVSSKKMMDLDNSPAV